MRAIKDTESVRVQEFVAHSTQVNCLALGSKSSQVLATGGEDAKVNIWRVGSVSNIWTLGQNKSPIECLCFDADELCVVSGAMNGSLKVFDLNEGKLARNLGSHQVNVTSVQYHPYGEFIVSGSSDCTMKLWDVRNKSCIETYTGHTKEITCVRFSPDGKWVASAGKDGVILFWDLIASKHIDTIKLSPSYVTSFEFNPAELSLAAMTTARTVRLWDLETMKTISYIPPESSQVRAMTFDNLGTKMFTTVKNTVKIWDTENNLRLVDSIDVGWDRISDMKVSNNNNQIVAAGFTSNFVSVYEVDLDQLISDDQNDNNDEQQRQQPASGKSRAVSTTPTTYAAVAAGEKDYKTEVPEKEVPTPRSEARADNGLDYRGLAPPKSIVPPASQVTYKDLYEENREAKRYSRPPPSTAFPIDEEEESHVVVNAHVEHAPGSPAQDMATSMGESFWKRFKQRYDQEKGEKKIDPHDVPMDTNVGVPHDELDDLLPPSSFADLPSKPRDNNRPSPSVAVKKEPSRPVTNSSSPASNPVPKRPVRSSSGLDEKAAALAGDGLAVVGMRHLKLDAANNKVDVYSGANNDTIVKSTANPEARITTQSHDLVDSLLLHSSRLTADLSNRLVSLRILKQLWVKGQVLDALGHLQGLADAMKLNNPQQVHLLSDFFGAVDLRGNGVLSLDACVQMLPILQDMLENSTSWHNQAVTFSTFKSLNSLLEAFGELIRNTRSMMVAGGVDLTREARLNKCNVCYSVFVNARSRLETLKHHFRQNSLVYDVLDSYQRLCSTYL
ncbi:hypothetical protein EON65_10135 [archaeon]|nr:MAG: hypothetical protein EON65_10135 [archaeon]